MLRSMRVAGRCRAVLGLPRLAQVGCQGGTFHQGCHHPHSQHPGAESGHGTCPGAVSDTYFSACWCPCSVVLMPGWGEAVATSPAAHHLSMLKNFPVMPSGWTALMEKKPKTVGIFGCWAYITGGY